MIQTPKTPFALSALPYPQNALAPTLSEETLRYHYHKHHRAYVDRLNQLVSGTDLEGLTLEAVIDKTAGNADQSNIFNNVAQVWNHDFYWKSLSPKGGGKPPKLLGHKIEESFDSYGNFVGKFIEAGAAIFGSGWIWLVEDLGRLKIIKTFNAQSPRSQSKNAVSAGREQPLWVVDVWEHAYYLDYQDRRRDYLTRVLDKLINWNFAEKNLQKNKESRAKKS